jgi:hypothetical protein
MAYFAELDSNNIVMRVISVANEELLIDGVENEAKGIIFCKSLFGEDTNWVQTSFNATIRVKYAGIGYTYDAEKDAFIPRKPFDSWTLNNITLEWEPPTPKPNIGDKSFDWSEQEMNWIETII